MSTPHFDVFNCTREWAEARGLRVAAFSEIDSTNSRAKEDRDFRDLYLARTQTQGRGRGSNIWVSSDGALFSSWRFQCASAPQPILAPLIGLALYSAAIEAWPSAALSLKAPNDLYLGKRKLAGILIETSTTGHRHECVIGLGLNVFSAPSEVATATSLSEHMIKIEEKSWTNFLRGWHQRLAPAIEASRHNELSASSRSELLLALNRFPALNEPFLGIDPLGQLKTASRTWYWHEL